MASTRGSFRRRASSFAAAAAFLRFLAASAFFEGTRILDSMRRDICSECEVLKSLVCEAMHCVRVERGVVTGMDRRRIPLKEHCRGG